MRVFSAILNGLYRFFNTLLNYKRKYDKKDVKYKARSFGQKIFLIVEMVAIPLLVLAFGLFLIPECHDNAVAYIVAVIGYILLGIKTVEYEIMNSVVAFRNMFFTALEERIGNTLENAIGDISSTNIEISAAGIEVKEDQPQEEFGEIKEYDNDKKKCRKIDLAIGILGIVLTAAFIGLAIWVGSAVIIK